MLTGAFLTYVNLCLEISLHLIAHRPEAIPQDTNDT